MKVSHKTLLRISGLIWFGIGIMLLNLGIHFALQGWDGVVFKTSSYSSIFSFLTDMTGKPENAACVVIALAMILGFFKSKKVLGKVVNKSEARIAQLDNPTSITNLYTKGNLLIILSMMLLGMSLKYIQVDPDIRGFVDIAVGTALIHGSVAYFRANTKDLHMSKIAP